MKRALLLLAAAALAAAPALAARHGHRAAPHFGKPHVTDLYAKPAKVTPPVTSPPPDGGDGPTTPPPAPTTRLSVRAAEYSLTLSSNPVAAGDALVELDNAGEDPHNLRIVPEGGTDADALVNFPMTPSGTRSKERFKLPAGTYEIYCPLLDHRDRGMRATLTVR